ncbi:nuclear transport factor 2 family protein [Streptomyces sp. CT34]|uniref:nuclear transport factor 2 family protein n=1 Tax=Streptomyces sp. CT34 TaxID=1553907 RepID=UPI000691C649|nr:nuclear transport factor 2 family protein [Streptomyces sp. CT34]
MSEPTSPRSVFARLIHGVAHREFTKLPELYAEDAVVEHPLAPMDSPERFLRGRDELREHFSRTFTREFDLRTEDVLIHETADPEVIIAEFTYRGRVVATDEPINIACVFVMRVRDGQIISSRDYAHRSAPPPGRT